jgi:hypothetical protein
MHLIDAGFLQGRKQLYRQWATDILKRLPDLQQRIFGGAVSQLVGFSQQNMQRQAGMLTSFDHLPVEFGQGMAHVHDQNDAAQ